MSDGWSMSTGGAGEAARIVAFNLGQCSGKPAYTAVTWFNPGRGETFEGTRWYYDACTGERHES